MVDLSNILDFSFFLPKQTDVSLDNLVDHLQNKPYFADDNLQEEEPFEEISEYECKIK